MPARTSHPKQKPLGVVTFDPLGIQGLLAVWVGSCISIMHYHLYVHGISIVYNKSHTQTQIHTHIYIYIYICHIFINIYFYLCPIDIYIYIINIRIHHRYGYRRCQNYRTKLGVQKYGKIPYLRTPPDPDSARIRILFYNYVFWCYYCSLYFSVL